MKFRMSQYISNVNEIIEKSKYWLADAFTERSADRSYEYARGCLDAVYALVICMNNETVAEDIGDWAGGKKEDIAEEHKRTICRIQKESGPDMSYLVWEDAEKAPTDIISVCLILLSTGDFALGKREGGEWNFVDIAGKDAMPKPYMYAPLKIVNVSQFSSRSLKEK